ncbi:MAG: 2OG-Fe(II) oxygenase [Elainella sp.]
MKRKGFATTQRPRLESAAVSPSPADQVQPLQPSTSEPASPPEQVAVTLLLTGGQQYTLAISPADPLLKQLYDTLMSVDGPVKRLFQISIHNGQAMLAFPSDRLVGLITDPPLLVEQNQTALAAAPVQSSLVSEYLQLDQFLTTAEHQALLDYVQQRAAEFVPTTTFKSAENYRESVVLYSFPEFMTLITERIQDRLPELFQRFHIAPFPVSQIEAQLTAHNDGQFYKIHNDNGSQDTATRELTYVYYFHREPKAFSGGELLIYDSVIQNNHYVQASTFHTIQPRNNSIVFFRSRYLHEVLPIRCPSQQFADSRFTINGWIRR